MQKPSFGEDLDRPLGADRPPEHHSRRRLPSTRVALLGAGAVAAALVTFVSMTGDPSGGQPFATASISAPKPVPAPQSPQPAVAQPVAAGDTTGSLPRRRQAGTVADIEERSGVKVVRAGGAGAPGALIIEVPQPLEVQLTPAPDRRVSQKYERGLLPKMAADGTRPADVYSRPLMLPRSLKAGAPRVAIVVGGMGLSRNGTAEALDKLPGEVTLAFAPYGHDLAAQAAKARARGHEIMLQAPMEPVDYPSNDPGPKTLTASADAAQNIERLHWIMSRFPGYVGVINFLGGKFTADPGAFIPVLREIGQRGLFYADDGTSTRSLARTLALAARVPVVTTDVVLDAVQRPEAIDAGLARLEAMARANGFAVGSATGLPMTLERVGAWARGLEARGIALVPLSAMAVRPQAVSGLAGAER